MKKTILLFLSLLFLSCTNDSISEPENNTTPENPVTEEPETPTETRLPLEINYRFNDLDYNKDYTSENLYTYDNSNRITEIEINSKMNNSNLMKFNYKIIYKGETNLAKGFEIKKYNYETGGTSTQYIKLKYPENYTEYIFNYAYYCFVNSYEEIINDNFEFNESQKIEINALFRPISGGENLFTGIKSTNVYYYGNSINAFVFYSNISNSNLLAQSYEAFFPYPQSEQKCIFTDVKFDYIFWLYFLEFQMFQLDIDVEMNSLKFLKADFSGTNSNYGIIFNHQNELSSYLENKYPLNKKFTGKQFYGNNPDKQINYIEYNVIYN